jgi:prepilin-type N-terminal cleavage/methylation domain-containing protein
MYRNKAGFTLIELLIVVSIIGILAIAAVTAYTGVQLKAARTEASTNLEMIRLLQEQLFADSGCYEPLVGGVCPNPGNNYACLFNDPDNCTDPGEIADPNMLPRFQPGPGRKFDYTIQIFNGPGNGQGLPSPVPVPYVPGATVPLANPDTPCFIATATGAVGNVLDKGDIFAIDCNNNRNF